MSPKCRDLEKFQTKNHEPFSSSKENVEDNNNDKQFVGVKDQSCFSQQKQLKQQDNQAILSGDLQERSNSNNNNNNQTTLERRRRLRRRNNSLVSASDQMSLWQVLTILLLVSVCLSSCWLTSAEAANTSAKERSRIQSPRR